MIKSWPGDKAEGWHIGRLRSKPEPDILGSLSSAGVGTACQAGEAKRSGPVHLEIPSCPIIQDTQCSSLFPFILQENQVTVKWGSGLKSGHIAKLQTI